MDTITHAATIYSIHCSSKIPPPYIRENIEYSKASDRLRPRPPRKASLEPLYLPLYIAIYIQRVIYIPLSLSASPRPVLHTHTHIYTRREYRVLPLLQRVCGPRNFRLHYCVIYICSVFDDFRNLLGVVSIGSRFLFFLEREVWV